MDELGVFSMDGDSYQNEAVVFCASDNTAYGKW